MISRLRCGDNSERRRALDDLCRQYHYPLYCYIRRRGLAHHDAEDALHDFLAKLLRLDTFKDADMEKGRLRSFLATCLQRFLINWSQHHPHRQKELSAGLELNLAESETRYRRELFQETETPERIFDRKWSQELLRTALGRLATEYRSSGKAELYTALYPVLLAGGSLRGHDSTQLAASLSLSEGALRTALSRLLADYRALLRREVRQTVERDAEVDEEIGHLLELFQKS